MGLKFLFQVFHGSLGLEFNLPSIPWVSLVTENPSKVSVVAAWCREKPPPKYFAVDCVLGPEASVPIPHLQEGWS